MRQETDSTVLRTDTSRCPKQQGEQMRARLLLGRALRRYRGSLPLGGLSHFLG